MLHDQDQQTPCFISFGASMPTGILQELPQLHLLGLLLLWSYSRRQSALFFHFYLTRDHLFSQMPPTHPYLRLFLTTLLLERLALLLAIRRELFTCMMAS